MKKFSWLPGNPSAACTAFLDSRYTPTRALPESMFLSWVLIYCAPPESRPAMASFLKPGMLLQGRLSCYSLLRDLYRSADDGVVYLAK